MATMTRQETMDILVYKKFPPDIRKMNFSRQMVKH